MKPDAREKKAARVLVKSRIFDNGALYNERRPHLIADIHDAVMALDAAEKGKESK